jgi:hypothetical protein
MKYRQDRLSDARQLEAEVFKGPRGKKRPRLAGADGDIWILSRDRDNQKTIRTKVGCECQKPMVWADSLRCEKCGHPRGWRYFGGCPECGRNDGPLREPHVRSVAPPEIAMVRTALHAERNLEKAMSLKRSTSAAIPSETRHLPWFICRRHKLRWATAPKEFRDETDRRYRNLLQKYEEVQAPPPPRHLRMERQVEKAHIKRGEIGRDEWQQ